MATYLELQTLSGTQDLLIRVGVALTISAYTISQSTTETLEKRTWAKTILTDPGQDTNRALRLLLAQNSTLTTAQITAVTDAQIQSVVNSIIPLLAIGSTG